MSQIKQHSFCIQFQSQFRKIGATNCVDRTKSCLINSLKPFDKFTGVNKIEHCTHCETTIWLLVSFIIGDANDALCSYRGVQRMAQSTESVQQRHTIDFIKIHLALKEHNPISHSGIKISFIILKCTFGQEYGLVKWFYVSKKCYTYKPIVGHFLY